MRKSILILSLFLIMAISLSGTVYTTTITDVTSKTLNKFGVLSSKTTYTSTGTADSSATANMPMYSNTFTQGDLISGNEIMITGVVNTALLTIVDGAAVPKVVPILEISANGTNWVTYRTYDIYAGVPTIGAVVTFPVSLSGVYAPYYRVRWQGYNTGLTLVWKPGVKGAVTTYITVPPK